ATKFPPRARALLMPADCAWPDACFISFQHGLRGRKLQPFMSTLSPLPACGERVSRTGGPRRVRGKHIWFAGTKAPPPPPPALPPRGGGGETGFFHFLPRRPSLLQNRGGGMVLEAAGVSTVADFVPRPGATRPDRVAIHFEGRRITYGDLDRRANQVANALIA